jgi:methylase of polypeptide subunit release factors
MFSAGAWMQPLEPVQGVKVTHRIHRKVWQIETEDGVIVVELNWQTGEMVASLQQERAK